MRFELYKQVALAADFPEVRLRRGDIATIVEYHPGKGRQEPGYSLEVFDAVGNTVAVITAWESQLASLNSNQLLHVRQIEDSVPSQ
ncbi:MAG: DUF4926 domain-containing protein [Burkholderiales bacterium]